MTESNVKVNTGNNHVPLKDNEYRSVRSIPTFGFQKLTP